MRAQNLSPDGVYKAQSGLAVHPSGTSVGHSLPVHFGEQKSPSIPLILTAYSSEPHPFGFGSS